MLDKELDEKLKETMRDFSKVDPATQETGLQTFLNSSALLFSHRMPKSLAPATTGVVITEIDKKDEKVAGSKESARPAFALIEDYYGKSTASTASAASTASVVPSTAARSEEHTSELQSQSNLVCR